MKLDIPHYATFEPSNHAFCQEGSSVSTCVPRKVNYFSGPGKRPPPFTPIQLTIVNPIPKGGGTNET